MTLGDFFQNVSEQPAILLMYFLALPLVAMLCYLWGREEGYKSPWCYVYSSLIYLSCIPGIFAITLNMYLMFFEKQSLLDANLYFQILPIASMLLTLWLIRMNVDFDEIPGFGKMSTLLMVIAAVMTLLWILEKTHLVAFTYVPFKYVLLILVTIFLVIIFGSRKVFKKN